MKRATLIGFIGCCLFVLLNLFNFIRNVLDGIPFEYLISNFIGVIAWAGITYFFFELYKRQK